MNRVDLMRRVVSSLLPLALVAALAGAGLGQRPTDRRGARYPAPKAGRPAHAVLPFSEVWPDAGDYESLFEVGRGKGVVMSPDLSVPGNRRFYERLGFAYFEDADWRNVLAQIRAHNRARPERRIELLILQTHGTNGHGLKLQTGPRLVGPRSYISIGALQENLEGTGVRTCVVAACNAGRLFRPRIYKGLNPRTVDPLFLPPTLGIVNASPGFDPARSLVRVVRRDPSMLEAVLGSDSSQLPPAAQALFEEGAAGEADARRPLRFAVSSLLVQLLTRDPALGLTAQGYDVRMVNDQFPYKGRLRLRQQLAAFLEEVAAREAAGAGPATESDR